MLEGLLSPLHLVLLVLVALIVFGLPLLVVFFLARWLDRRLQRRTGVKLSILGIVMGGITDVVSSGILAMPVFIYVMVKHDLLHAPNGPAAIASFIHSNAWLYGLQLTIGIGCSVLGGYVAAWIATHDEPLNGLLSSFLCVALGFYSLFSGKDSQSVFVQILLLVIAPAFAFLGGYVRQSQNRIGRALA